MRLRRSRPSPADAADGPIGRRVIGVVAAARNLEAARVGPHSTLSELGFDSLSAVKLAFALEEEFDVDLHDDAWRTVSDVGGIIAAVSRALDPAGR